MAITTADQFFNAPKQMMLVRKGNLAGLAQTPFSLWAAGAIPAAGTLAVGNTTTGILFDSSTTGAPTINTFGAGNTGYLASARMRISQAGSIIIYDRLWGAGAVSLTSLATTTFSSQPSYTGRLPGGNDYQNLEIYLEITTTVSATATTVSVTYTNENGDTGRTAGISPSLSGFAANRLQVLTLQDGDKGVQKIESVTVGGTVATAGAFNVIVARRLAVLDIREINSIDAQAWDMLGAPQIWDTTCLWFVSIANSNQTGAMSMQLDIVNG